MRRLLPHLLVLWTIACHSWRPVEIPSGSTGGQLAPWRPIRVTRADGGSVVIRHPVVLGDSVVGEAGSAQPRVALALTDVRRIEERRLSGGKTALVVGGGVAGLVALMAAALASGGGGMPAY